MNGPSNFGVIQGGKPQPVEPTTDRNSKRPLVPLSWLRADVRRLAESGRTLAEYEACHFTVEARRLIAQQFHTIESSRRLAAEYRIPPRVVQDCVLLAMEAKIGVLRDSVREYLNLRRVA